MPVGRVRQAVRTAASGGHLHILRWLHANHDSRVVWGNGELLIAVENQQLETALWLHEHTSPLTVDDKKRILDMAVISGRVKAVEWVEGFDLPAVETDISEAVRNGHVSILEWAARRLCTQFDGTHMDAAVSSGQQHVAEWLRSHASISTVSTAALLRAMHGLSPRDAVVPWALQNLTVDNVDAVASGIDETVIFGSFDVIKVVHEYSKGSCSTHAMDDAACLGKFDVVKWLHNNWSEGCTTVAMDGAARNGRLDIVQWLHENRSEGCTTRAMDGAAKNNHLDVIKWLHEHRREGCTTRAIDKAAAGGHLEVVQWLYENRAKGCTVKAMNDATAEGHLDVVKWLHANRTEGCTTWEMDWAARHGHLDVVKWLHENRTEGCTTDAMDIAAARQK